MSVCWALFFWGKKSCSANRRRGVEQLFPRKQQSLAARHCPKKNQVPHMLLFSRKKKKTWMGSLENHRHPLPSEAAHRQLRAPTKWDTVAAPQPQSHPMRAQKQSRALLSPVLRHAWLVVSAELGSPSRAATVNQYHISKPRRRSGGRGRAIAWKTHRRSTAQSSGLSLGFNSCYY